MISPRLIVITDTRVAPSGRIEERVARVCALARAGSVMVQLRDADLPIRERLRLGEGLARITRAAGQHFVVNDRVDLALVLDADGVHLGESSVSSDDARALLASRSREPWVSRAWHDPSLNPAPGAGAYLLSPIVLPRKGRPALGISILEIAKRRLGQLGSARLFALGGVDADTAAACLVAGADGVAVIGAALSVDDPRPLLAALDLERSAG